MKTYRPHFSPAFSLIVILPLMLLGVGSASFAETPAVPDLDWYPISELTPEQLKEVAPGCCGAYIDPMKQSSDSASSSLNKNESTGKLTVSGEQSQITKVSTVVTGDIELLQDGRKLTGDRAELFHDPQSVELEGNVGFREPGFLLRGRSASVNLEDDTLSIEQARYVLHEIHVHGEAASIRRNNTGVIRLEDSTYSYCEPNDPLWQLHGEYMSLDFARGQGKASHVRLEILDIPVFYFPYLRFPIGGQRQSGLLAPSISTGTNGLDITQPYYFNLAPNYDFTLIPRYIADRGLQTGGEFRHLSTEFESRLSATWLEDDKKNHDNRWLIGIKTDGGARQPWSAQVDATRVSDIDYFDDLDNSGLAVSRATHLKQEGSVGYMTDHWSSDIDLLNYQTLRKNASLEDPYEKIPSLSTSGNYALPGNFSLDLFDGYTNFDHNDESQVSGNRFVSDASLSWQQATQAYSVTPAAHAYYRSQQLQNNPNNESPESAIAGFSLDNSLFLERDDNQRYLQVLQPRLFYTYTDYENQDDAVLFDSDDIDFSYDQLYSTRRISGGDKVGDADQVSVGIESRWLHKEDGSEWMSLGLGQTFYQADRRVNGFDMATFALLPTEYQNRYTRNRSPIAAQWQWHIHPQWFLNGEIAWRETDDTTEQGSLSLQHKGDAGELFTVSYRHNELLTHLNATTYIMDTVQQGDVSTLLPINNQWAFTGSLSYDFTNTRYVESLAGVQYEDCCWRLRTVLRQWKENPDEVYNPSLQENKHGFFIEIQFKNLASTSNKIGTLLKHSIYGYSPDDN